MYFRLRRNTLHLLLISLVAILSFTNRAGLGAGERLERYEYHARRMGTEFRIVLYAPSEESALEASWAVFEKIEALEQVISDYREESELERVEALAAERPKVVSPELYDILEKSLRLARLTDGAFDITVKPVVDLWREARRQQKLPEEALLHRTLARVGFRNVLLNPRNRSVRLTVPGMRLDFGGIGKGWAADIGLQILRDRGISRALIDAGGDLRIGAPPPDSRGWRVAIADGDTGGETVWLSECAVATSGDAYQFVEVAGERFSHIVDPRTGIGVRHGGTVTVIARDGSTADALATAFSVLDAETALGIADRIGEVEVRIRRETVDGKKVLVLSTGFPS